MIGRKNQAPDPVDMLARQTEIFDTQLADDQDSQALYEIKRAMASDEAGRAVCAFFGGNYQTYTKIMNGIAQRKAS